MSFEVTSGMIVALSDLNTNCACPPIIPSASGPLRLCDWKHDRQFGVKTMDRTWERGNQAQAGSHLFSFTVTTSPAPD